jgi:hypothetical protein
MNFSGSVGAVMSGSKIEELLSWGKVYLQYGKRNPPSHFWKSICKSSADSFCFISNHCRKWHEVVIFSFLFSPIYFRFWWCSILHWDRPHVTFVLFLLPPEMHRHIFLYFLSNGFRIITINTRSIILRWCRWRVISICCPFSQMGFDL